jgi:flagellin
MSVPISIQEFSNTSTWMETSIRNKDGTSDSLLNQTKQEPNTGQDFDLIEKTNSVDAATLDIPETIINQSRTSTQQSTTMQDSGSLPQKETKAVNRNPSSASSLAQDDQNIINCLKDDWLEEAEDVISQRYGLTGDGSDLSVVLENNPEAYLASTNFEFGSDGKAYNESLHVVVPTALPSTLPNGGEAPNYDDRVITHEMVHAIMGRTMNFESLPTWFAEGTAEFIHGANERVATDLSRKGGIEGAAAIQNALGDGTNNTWVSDSLHYSAATMAVRYLHKQIEAAGHSGGIKDLLTNLKNNPTENLDQALSHVSNYANTQAFITDYVTNGNGEKFIHNLDIAGEFQNAVTGGDTGGIGGATADNGPVRTAKSVIPDIYDPTNTPLKHFHVIWPALDPNIAHNTRLSTNQINPLNSKAIKSNSKTLGTHIDVAK